MAEIIPGIHQVDGANANSYVIIEGDGSLTLIDTGMSKDGKKILDYMQTRMSKKASDVKTIILTHCHVDHVRGAYEIKKATGAKIAIHESDADYLTKKKNLPRPGGIVGVLFGVFAPFFNFTAVEPDISLKENDRIGSLVIVETPGHTPGSITLYDQNRRVVFVGDTITNRGGKLQGSPKQFTQDLEGASRSIGKISALDFEILLSGHGDPVRSKGAEKVKELAKSFSK